MMKLKTLPLFTALMLISTLVLHAKEKLNDAPGKSYVYKRSGGKPREMEIYFPPGHDPRACLQLNERKVLYVS